MMRPCVVCEKTHTRGGRRCAACFNVARVRPLAERFWAKVTRSDGCWLWSGTHVKGYGRLRLSPSDGGRDTLAHRISWELHFGPIPDDQQVLHRCDNPPCVNPAHLFLGTHDENMADKASKGRSARFDGERNPAARLTAAQVVAIRAEYADGSVSHRALAEKYGVSKAAIQRAVVGASFSLAKAAP